MFSNRSLDSLVAYGGINKTISPALFRDPIADQPATELALVIHDEGYVVRGYLKFSPATSTGQTYASN